MKFLIDNLFLVVLALVSGGLLVWPLLKKGGGSAALSALQATQLINHSNAIVVDMRDEKDFALGSLAGARSMPFATLAERAAELVRFKARPVLIVCDSGQQSAKAVATFKTQGFDEAYSLAGGIAAWKQAGLPLVVSGRDSSRSSAKDPVRRSRNDHRSGDRNKSGKTPRRELPGVVVAPSVAADEPAAAAAANADTLVPSEGTPSPTRVKELS